MITVLTYFFSGIVLFAALMVLFSKNPVHSILWLIMSFFGGSGIILLLEIEFIAMLFLVVYMGAIAVLFLFVVMMLNIKIVELTEEYITYLPLGLILFFVFFMELFYSFKHLPFEKSLYFNNTTWYDTTITNLWFAILDNLSNVQIIGLVIYDKYFYSFILASIILLVAMIGSIVLTLDQTYQSRRQNIYRQLKLNLASSIKLTKKI